MALKIFILAKFEPLRLGLVQSLAASDIEIVGDAASLDALVGYARTGKVDVFVVDLQTLVSEADWVVRLDAWLRGQQVIFLGSPGGGAIPAEAVQLLMQQESFGFLAGDGSSARLLEAIRLVAAKTFVCDMALIRPFLARLERWSRAMQTQTDPGPERLTPRESEVLALVAEGLTNGEIARRLVLSEGTVKAHISHIMARLRIEQRVGLVRYALSRDWAALPSDDPE